MTGLFPMFQGNRLQGHSQTSKQLTRQSR